MSICLEVLIYISSLKIYAKILSSVQESLKTAHIHQIGTVKSNAGLATPAQTLAAVCLAWKAT